MNRKFLKAKAGIEEALCCGETGKVHGRCGIAAGKSPIFFIFPVASPQNARKYIKWL
jgi:hypothetical protein